MKQRIKVAAALVHDPAVLLLDEPFNGADPRQRLHMIELFRRLAAEGRTIIFSSHILEEVERLAERVLVVVGGRLAASGDFREIRRLMTDRPHTFTLRTSDDRRLAAALVAHESVLGVELGDGPPDRADVAARRVRARDADDRPLLRRHAARVAADRRVARGRLLLPGEPMIGIIAALTLRQLLGRGRTILLGLVALLPILLALVYRLGSEDTDQQEWVAQVLLDGLIVTILLPLLALVYGTAALGAEIEDGTAVYLLAKPVSRAQIILGKLLAAWAADGGDRARLGARGRRDRASAACRGTASCFGFAIALVAGSLVYSALFVMLSVVTSRALIAGLVYVFIWEGLINGLFAGTRLLSVRHYTLAVADIFVDLPRSVFDAKLGSVPAVGLMIAVGRRCRSGTRSAGCSGSRSARST